jgi:hypothetical protein
MDLQEELFENFTKKSPYFEVENTEKNSTVCDSCSANIIADVKFCSYCPSIVNKTKFCLLCDAKLIINLKFCTKCGAKV